MIAAIGSSNPHEFEELVAEGCSRARSQTADVEAGRGMPIVATEVHPALHVPAKWHLGSQNDGLFIIDRPPRPSNDHPVHEHREGISPTLIIPLGDMRKDIAQRIVDAHNAAIEALRS